jgi:hypothetical protein
MPSPVATAVPSPAGHRPRRRPLPALLPALLLAVVLLAGGGVGTALAGVPPAAAPATPQLSSYDLGNLLCAPYAPYCFTLWRNGLSDDQPFNVLISEVCLFVGANENEDAGIQCLQTAIQDVPSLPDAVLVDKQFAQGERQANPYWRNKSDHEWARTTAAYFQRIPAYCDQATPVIFDYFPCLLREVQFFQTVLKQAPTQHFD